MPLQFQEKRSETPSLRLPGALRGAAAPTLSTARRQGVDTSLLLAAAVTIALYFVPWAGYVTYPLRLLVTFVHEGSHALAALITGGGLHGLAIQPDGSGVTLTSGGIGGLISSAGYLGATLYGALLLTLMRRGVPASRLLLMTAGFVGLMTLPGILSLSGFTLLWGALLTAGLVLAARRLSTRAAEWLTGFIGVQCVLNALFDLRTLFVLSTTSTTPTDAMNLQNATGIPAVFWALLWIVGALGILWGVLIKPALKQR